MSDFENATYLRCPICGTRYLSCEGYECDCYRDDDKPNQELDVETLEHVFGGDDLMGTITGIVRLHNVRS